MILCVLQMHISMIMVATNVCFCEHTFRIRIQCQPRLTRVAKIKNTPSTNAKTIRTFYLPNHPCNLWIHPSTQVRLLLLVRLTCHLTWAFCSFQRKHSAKMTENQIKTLSYLFGQVLPTFSHQSSSLIWIWHKGMGHKRIQYNRTSWSILPYYIQFQPRDRFSFANRREYIGHCVLQVVAPEMIDVYHWP